MASYRATSNDAQRLFLQAVLSRGLVSAKLAQLLWSKAVEAVKAADDSLHIPYSDSRDAWEKFIQNVNASLDSLDLEFRHLHDETSGREMYAVVNRKGDEIAQMATDYTPAEIAFFKATVEQIMLAPNESFSLSSMAALREASLFKFSKTQAEVILGSFVAKGWLLKSQRGRYSLSTRTLLELQPYLRSTYPDEVIECTICFEIITRGVACYTPNCKARMHYHCFATFRRNRTVCAACNANWPADPNQAPLVPVGERAAKDGQIEGRRRRARSVDASDEDEDMTPDHSQATESQPSQPKTKPKKQPAKKGKGKQVDMDVDETSEEGERDGRADDVKPSESQLVGKRRGGQLQ